nr:TonB-dependent receptor [Aliikangiella sp. G2MR2-5]
MLSIEKESADDGKLIVTADLLNESQLGLAASVSIIDEEKIRKNNATHLSEILNLAPNVNFSSGASRGRFIQIRGVGERSEFVEPINYSVGVIVDGIDLTGLAGGALLFDTQQVEILRGPQGTVYGANALAGLINIVSAAPQESLLKVSAGFESYNGQSFMLVKSEQVNEAFGYRISYGNYRSDGYVENVTLNRDDTNNFDEQGAKLNLSYKINSDFSLSGNFIWIDVDNGYDAFSLDNNRQTYSDEPGYDRQETLGASVVAKFDKNEYSLETTFAFVDSDLAYAYDEDWSYPGICDNTPCDSNSWGFDWWYSSFDKYLRNNDNWSLDFRLINHESEEAENGGDRWVLGAYFRDQSVSLIRTYTFNINDFGNNYDTRNSALYGQYDKAISSDWTISGGLRFEKIGADYFDSEGYFSALNESFWGGKLAVEYQASTQMMTYGLISRGYKGGGFNTSQMLPENQRAYDAELMWNYEIGLKGYWSENAITLQSSLFYQDRDDIQSKQSYVTSLADGQTLQDGGSCPCNFTDYFLNAKGAKTYGAEIEISWRELSWAHYYASIALLDSKFDSLQSFTHVEADLNAEPPVAFDLTGRQLAHAPESQWVVGADFLLDDWWTLNFQFESKDDFYLSDRHQVRADNYNIYHITLAYQADSWQLEVFARNLGNENIVTRGFGSFGNDPRKFYELEPYFQLGTPKILGLRAAYQW